MKLKVMILNLLLLLLSLSIANNAYSEETIAKSETTIVNSERKLEGVKGPVQAVVNTGTTIVNSEEKPKGIDGFEFLTDLKFWFFITGCGIISILVKVVDQSIKLNGIDSTKRIRNLKWSLLEWFLWFVSASIVGCLGYLVGLFQLSAQSAVVIGLGWPTLFAKLKSQYGNQTEVEKAVEKQMNEVKKVVEKQVIEKLDLQGPNKTIKLIQKRLIELDYLKEFNDDGSRFDEGVIGPATSAAIDAFLLKKGLVGQDRIDILGNEDDPDSWKQLLALLTDQKNDEE